MILMIDIHLLDHDIAETVALSINYKMKEEFVRKTETKFTFTLDMSVLLAQSLVMNATNSAALKQIEMMYNALLSVTNDEQKGLDQRLLSAFKQLQFLESWSLYDKQGIIIVCSAFSPNNIENVKLITFSGQFEPKANRSDLYLTMLFCKAICAICYMHKPPFLMTSSFLPPL